ncbi:3-oxoacyl-ACP reductase FabG [Mangrovimicrobium sediminis]|uniref:3-oxoacyl-ACP reductase FabG n=1 Tax=Mangrovimicrobium sediminis TaxID=2562682 RepID=A0A4Z0LZT2_9GAMM|nr:3-oxoacyl-ACP reductase FabG [Haliea sp. SAOS-164]TGD72667.1 3-oxoacyl-ACP reductase FabG [Haliea sp. SAOS-164]
MEKRQVLVTGASRGIGRATALRLAGDGFHVSVHYRGSEDAAAAVVAEIEAAGGSADLLQFDLAEREQVRECLEARIAEQGAYYGVVCNAGLHSDNAFPAMTDEQWDGVVRTNLDGFYNLLHPLVMPMIRRRGGGRIVTLASVSGIIGNRGQTNYSAAKAGVIGATKALAVELAKRKITVNCVAPGLVETDMTDALPSEEILKAVPLRRFAQPQEVAGLIGYLMSDEAGYITRQVISINGGLC